MKMKIIGAVLVWLLVFAGRCGYQQDIYKIEKFPCEECQEEYSNICVEVRLFDEEARKRFISAKESDSVSFHGGILEAWEDLVPKATLTKEDETADEKLFAAGFAEYKARVKGFSTLGITSALLNIQDTLDYLQELGFDGYIVFDTRLESLGCSWCMFDCYGMGRGGLSLDSAKKTKEYQNRIIKKYDNIEPFYSPSLSFYDLKTKKIIRKISSKNYWDGYERFYKSRFIKITEYLDDEGLILEKD
jgi:hypothetical protein